MKGPEATEKNQEVKGCKKEVRAVREAVELKDGQDLCDIRPLRTRQSGRGTVTG